MSQADRPKPFQPRGAVDGMAVDTAMIRRMQLWGRWGSSCGTGFYKDAFCDRNMIWNTYRPYLHDRPPQPWTLFGLNGQNGLTHGTRSHRHRAHSTTRRLKAVAAN
jgi:hypothetical protein